MTTKERRDRRTMLRWRLLLIAGVNLCLVIVANYVAFWLRFDGMIPQEALVLWVGMLPWLALTRMAMFVPFRLYGTLWRYASTWDLRNIVGGVLSSTLLFYLLVHWLFRSSGYPRSVFLMDSILLICLMGGARVARRLYREMQQPRCPRRVLIYGAGDAGEGVVREMRSNPDCRYEPIGFIDDDPAKQGQRIHGVKVIGRGKNLREIVRKRAPNEVLLAIPRAEAEKVRAIVSALEPFHIPIKTLPSLREVLDGKVTIADIRDVSMEDLLARTPIDIDIGAARALVGGRRVLVTGAAGSIGAELCRQLSASEPDLLILLDRSESALHDIDGELERRFPRGRRAAVLADVRHVARLDDMFARYAPQVVFHAAAYKHVPLMEAYPEEAVLNNVVGTRRLAEAAARHHVETFVLISTDKAVNPTSIMGATKRVAELLIEGLASRARYRDTKFCSVRFGNVLGSSGSVVPLFVEQIERGGPVTVTHPEVTRYFMTIPEAVQLVLRAAGLARGGEVFVLEMGERVKVADLARQLIRISGRIPDTEVPIVYTGLRAGEKLYEELVGSDEAVERSGAAMILTVQARQRPELGYLEEKMGELEQLALQGDAGRLIRVLGEVVPTFAPLARTEDAPGEEAAIERQDPGQRRIAPGGVRRRGLKVLFVCTESLARSRTAEGLLREFQGGSRRHVARSAGTSPHAARRLTTRDVAWADVVAVMEPAHRDVIERHWARHAHKTVVLGIPDDFAPGDSELAALLKPKVKALLEDLEELSFTPARVGS